MLPTKFREITDIAADKRNIDQELMYSIGLFIFTETKKEMTKLDKLSIVLDGFGIWFYRKNKLIEEKALIERMLRERGGPQKRNHLTPFSDDELRIKIQKIDSLLETYKEYISGKKETRQKRKNESLLQGQDAPIL